MWRHRPDNRGRVTAGSVALVAVLLLLVLGVARLLQLRFERGDVYPRYSSLRSDPLGTRVLLESLRRLPGITVRRNLEPLDQLQGGPGTTVLLLGVTPSPWWGEGELERLLTSLAQQGSRVVLTFSGKLPLLLGNLAGLEELGGDDDDDSGDDADDDTGDSDSGEKTDESHPGAAGQGGCTPAGFELWGVSLLYRSLPEDPSTPSGRAAVSVALQQDLPLPEPLPWHSPLVFTGAGPEWQVVYARDDAPVLLQRSLARGSLVLASDSYLLSNEALLADRRPAWLAWLVGPASQVVFDEVHLGVQRRLGVMVLARRYHLLGFFAALAVLAALFVWRAACPFAPAGVAVAATGSSHRPPARTSQEALVNLLRRGLNDRQLLDACVSAWRRSFATSVSPQLQARIEQLAAEQGHPHGSPQEGYRQIHRTLSAASMTLSATTNTDNSDERGSR